MSERTKEILEARARALAARPVEERTGRASLTLFSRGGQLYGIPLHEVLGAGRLREMSPIPGGLPWMGGVLSFQGEVLTLVDLLTFWGLEAAGVSDFPTYVVIAHGGARVGLLVEELLGVRDVDDEAVRYEGTERSGVSTVARLEGAPVFVLSARHFLADPRFQA